MMSKTLGIRLITASQEPNPAYTLCENIWGVNNDQVDTS